MDVYNHSYDISMQDTADYVYTTLNRLTEVKQRSVGGPIKKLQLR